jgi:hypothetical protein|tara:strand:- start:1404 stop:1712 length:309 start_codon:yes stop_codon:yes gene_type:complete
MKKLMFENVAEVGDKIRAYDFIPREERGDCYLEGQVIDKGQMDNKMYLCYKIKVDKRIWCGNEKNVKPELSIRYVPFETDTDYFEKKFYNRFKVQRVMKLEK